MQVEKLNFPRIIPDNDAQYFQLLQGVIESVDELSSLSITKKPTSYLFRLSPSSPVYAQPLLRELLDYHNMVGIKLILGKSIRTTSTISFEIQKVQP